MLPRALLLSAVVIWAWTFVATKVGVYLYLEALATLALAVPLLGERFGAVTAIGGGLVLASVYLGQRERT